MSYAFIIFLFVLGCKTAEEKSKKALLREEPAIKASEPTLRRLTISQYKNAINSLLGSGLLFPSNLEPDIAIEGLISIGSSYTTISPTGVMRYEEAAYDLVAQVLEDENRVAAILSCVPSSAEDVICAKQFVQNFGYKAWRRPLSELEISEMTELISSIGQQSNDFYIGLEFGIAAFLQSPYFLYRSEHGTGSGKLQPYELASKLSFLLWNDIPDEELFNAAENGVLNTPEGLSEQIDRMIEDPRILSGINHMFIDFFELYKLDEMIKDPLVFNHAHPDFGFAAQEEILYGLNSLILIDEGDFRELMTSQHTMVDLRLAALYDIPASQMEGFGEVWLEPSGGRRGLLGQAGILAMHSHAASTSATLRGRFIRKKLLCHIILPAPAEADVSLPEADVSSPTLRERLASHLEDPDCAGCHGPLDGVGLGLENFDGIGRWRDRENGAVIDPSGVLDGVAFKDAWELGDRIANHPDFGPCFAQHLYEYATGHQLHRAEADYHIWLTEAFVFYDWSFLEMIRTLAQSDAFQQIGEIK